MTRVENTERTDTYVLVLHPQHDDQIQYFSIANSFEQAIANWQSDSILPTITQLDKSEVERADCIICLIEPDQLMHAKAYSFTEQSTK